VKKAKRIKPRTRHIEMCRVVDTVLIDQETVYAPRQGNDRLLLGLKGGLNEMSSIFCASVLCRPAMRRPGAAKQGGRTRQCPASPALVHRARAGLGRQSL
jgi:hypothetical protein